MSSGGHSTKHESTTVALRGWKEDLSPSDSRNLALTSQVLLGPGCPQERSSEASSDQDLKGKGYGFGI